MKKLLRLILIFLVFALMAALSAITALACSPEDSNPEHHENIIQTDEEKPTCLRGGYYVLECTVCGMRCTYQTDPAMPHSFGPWEVVQGKNLPVHNPARSERIAVHATSGMKCPRRQRIIFGLLITAYSRPVLLQDTPVLSVMTAVRKETPSQCLRWVTNSAHGLLRHNLPAWRTASKNVSARAAVRRRQNRLPRRTTNSAHGLLRRSPPAWQTASKSGSVRNAV